MSTGNVMSIEESKVIEWLSNGLLAMGGIIFSYGMYIGRQHLKRFDKLEKTSKYIVPRKEFNQLKKDLRKAQLEVLALQMSHEDGKHYEVIEQGELGFVILEVEDNERAAINNR